MHKKGITRKQRGSGKRLSWEYFDPRGKRITDAKVIERCNKLVLPPAWVDVWISSDANADLQATGVDAKGRRQYRYHVNWTKARAEEKFDSMTGFAKTLPTIRKKVEADLRLSGMPKNKVIALIVRLIDLYHFRVGNDEYARANKSYGLTTMKEGHVTIDRSRKAEGKYDAIFEFMGKSGKLWKRRIWEDDLVALIIASGEVGGLSKKQDLFRYEDETGADHDVKSHHINEYLDAITKRGDKVTAKDFRTWAATWKTAHRLSEQHDPATDAARKKVSRDVIKTVSSDLGNTPAVCATSYIHPIILADWSHGAFRSQWNQARDHTLNGLSNRNPRRSSIWRSDHIRNGATSSSIGDMLSSMRRTICFALLLACGNSLPVTPDYPFQVVVDPKYVYLTTDTIVSAVPIDAGPPIDLVVGQPYPTGIVVDATSLYWLNQKDSTVRTVAKL